MTNNNARAQRVQRRNAHIVWVMILKKRKERKEKNNIILYCWPHTAAWCSTSCLSARADLKVISRASSKSLKSTSSNNANPFLHSWLRTAIAILVLGLNEWGQLSIWVSAYWERGKLALISCLPSNQCSRGNRKHFSVSAWQPDRRD